MIARPTEALLIWSTDRKQSPIDLANARMRSSVRFVFGLNKTMCAITDGLGEVCLQDRARGASRMADDETTDPLAVCPTAVCRVVALRVASRMVAGQQAGGPKVTAQMAGDLKAADSTAADLTGGVPTAVVLMGADPRASTPMAAARTAAGPKEAGPTEGVQQVACLTVGGPTAVFQGTADRLLLAGVPTHGPTDEAATVARLMGRGDPILGGARLPDHPAAARSAVLPAAPPDRGPGGLGRRPLGSSPTPRHSNASCRRSCGS